MEPNNKSFENQNVSSRRKFLTKVGAVSLISVVPSRTVWATNCTISGNLSNHASAVERCEQSTVVFNGRSGGFWKNIGETQTKNGITRYKKAGAVASAFSLSKSGIHRPGDGKPLTKAIEHIANEIDNGPMSDHHIFGVGAYPKSALRTALQGGGYPKQLASAYLNAYYGFYTLPAHISAADYVIGLDDQVPSVYTSDEMEQAIQATHTNGVVIGFPFPL